MSDIKGIGIAIGIVVLGFVSTSFAQFGYDPFMAQMAAYDRQMDAYLQQQMQALQQQSEEAVANMQRFYIDYYRQHTGDWTTPDHLALQYGDQLHCQHHPVQCKQGVQHAEEMSRISANGHAKTMANIDSWGAMMNQIGNDSSSMLDASHRAFFDQWEVQEQGHADFVQGVIHGEATFYGPGSGPGMSLPMQPNPNTQYTTPGGAPLSFNFQTGTWYQSNGFGGWSPLSTQR